jgi:hypothetical protein
VELYDADTTKTACFPDEVHIFIDEDAYGLHKRGETSYDSSYALPGNITGALCAKIESQGIGAELCGKPSIRGIGNPANLDSAHMPAPSILTITTKLVMSRTLSISPINA